jgi:hypothetical protein
VTRDVDRDGRNCEEREQARSLAIVLCCCTQPGASSTKGRLSVTNSIIAGGIVATTTDRKRVIIAVSRPINTTFNTTHATSMTRAAPRTEPAIGERIARPIEYPGGKWEDGTRPRNRIASAIERRSQTNENGIVGPWPWRMLSAMPT